MPKSRSTKKHSALKNFFFYLFILCLLLIGLALIFNGQIRNFLVKDMTSGASVRNLTTQKIAINKEKKATFDFDQVQSLDLETILKARLSANQVAVIGGIAAPSVKMNLPIIKGVSNYSLAIGAGTMKADQEMGSGNYALASHHMIDDSLLFSPLVSINPGAEIYLTDLATVYTYKVTVKKYVAPTAIEVIDDVPGKALLTLVTCDTTGSKRLIVQAELTAKTSVKTASQAIADAFDLKRNNGV